MNMIGANSKRFLVSIMKLRFRDVRKPSSAVIAIQQKNRRLNTPNAP